MSLHQISKTSHQTSKAFAITFDLPFDRQAIWKAIHARNGALGVDSATRVEHEPPSDKQCVDRAASVRAEPPAAAAEPDSHSTIGTAAAAASISNSTEQHQVA